ncbi:hypothetical protein FACS1894181_14900 [Bacteroidia bacterium]|nr:hypothetical protein FACS1894181_14900 [Bacteroidia bacterium]
MIALPLAHITAKFILDGKAYEIDTFKVSFAQPKDFKGQPQHEVKGGQLMVTLSQLPGDELFVWAKTSTS